MSAARPLGGFSGAQYTGVPNARTSVDVERSSPEKSWAQPKSAKYGWWSLIKILVGLMSSCLIFLECAKASADTKQPNQEVRCVSSVLGNDALMHFLWRN